MHKALKYHVLYQVVQEAPKFKKNKIYMHYSEHFPSLFFNSQKLDALVIPARFSPRFGTIEISSIITK